VPCLLAAAQCGLGSGVSQHSGVPCLLADAQCELGSGVVQHSGVPCLEGTSELRWFMLAGSCTMWIRKWDDSAFRPVGYAVQFAFDLVTKIK